MAIAAGDYTATYGAAALGYIENGFALSHTFEGENAKSYTYGSTVVDSIYSGGEVKISTILKEPNLPGLIDAVWPHHANYGTIGEIGTFALGSGIAKPLVLTVRPGSTAATLGPTSITGGYTIILNGQEVTTNLNNRHRVVPITFRLFPDGDAAGGMPKDVSWYVTT